MKQILFLIAIVIPAAAGGQILTIVNFDGECGSGETYSNQLFNVFNVMPIQVANQVSYAGSDFVANASADLDFNYHLSGRVVYDVANEAVAGDGLSISATGNTGASYNKVKSLHNSFERGDGIEV